MHVFPRIARTVLALVMLGGLTGTAIAPLSAAPASPAADIWPLTVTAGGGTIVLWEPQIRSWQDYTHMTGIAAVAVTPPGATAPVYGVLSFTSLATADVPSSRVALVNPKLDASQWQAPPGTDVNAITAYLLANLHVQNKPFLPLTMALSSVPQSALPRTVPVRSNPPQILVSRVPAALVVFDGTPSFAPIAGTTLAYAVNTNWQIIRDTAARLFYIHTRAGWYDAPGTNGPFTPTVAPAAFAAIPATGPLAWVKAALHAPKPAAINVQKVIVSTVPSALIGIGGEPQFANIPGTQLRYVTNTNADLFFSRDTMLWYVLIAGRWFSAQNLNGPWIFASTHLPASFKQIPEDGPKGHVLVSVPGTTQAFYAADTMQVPRIAPVDPSTLSLTVTYDGGAPVLRPIAGTPLQYAANTTTDVVVVDATHYFACARGVWFAGGSANGPWTPATYVPEVIYSIPESSPLYHVTFVHVYNSQGVAQVAPIATPAPKPKATYQNFAPSQFSQGDAAAYYNTATAGYWGGYAAGWGGYAYGTGYYNQGYVGDTFWVPTLPTYGNYNDTTYAQQRAQVDANDPRSVALDPRVPAGHGPRSVAGPNTNVYAAADGIYRFADGGWQKNAGGDNWVPAPDAPPSLLADQRARRAGYNGVVSLMPAAGN
jgi:hypothetical protein